MPTDNKKTISPPKKFVGLHSHTHFSIGDGLNTPEEHIDFAISNGMDSLALTDHGNMNGIAAQIVHCEKLKAKGANFKGIPGIEAYFVPSLSDWKTLYDKDKEEKQKAAIEKKMAAAKKKAIDFILDSDSKAKEAMIANDLEGSIDEDLQGGSGVEDEEASKSNKWKNPIYQRNHLVLLPKNSEGLKALFSCVSESFIDGFYRFPRMDFEMLRKHANGNIIASSACIGGLPSRIIFDNQVEQDWEKYTPNDDNKELIQTQLAEMVSRFQEALGPENFYLEIQWNKLGAQHLANYHIMECAKRTGAKLVTTADAHYSNPEYWRERMIYQHMARSQFMKGNELILPKSVDELKCELYPKNAEQMWSTYLDLKEQYPGVYDDDLVKGSIERTHEIAHDQIDKPEIDRQVKFPSMKRLIGANEFEAVKKKISEKTNSDGEVSENDIAFEELKKQTIEGAIFRKINDKPEYVDRLKHELGVIKHLGIQSYFLTYKKIMEVVGKECLTGPARGSAGASLVAYALNITQIDPIKYGLVFDRFLSKKKYGMPDIDSDCSDRDKALKLLHDFFDEENVIPVSNFNQLQMRSLIKDICRLHDVDFSESNAITKDIETETKAVARKEAGFDATQWFLTFENAKKDSQTFRNLLIKYPDFEKMIKVLFKNNRNVSRHAGGVCITDDAKNQMPMIKSGGVLQTPWAEGLKTRHLENFGFLKYDILALGTLRIFENCIKRILQNHHGIKRPKFADIKKYYYENLHPDNNDMSDMNVYKNVYWKQNYAGIFQFVRAQVQEIMAKTKPRSIEDIAIITSLYRPGPLSVGADKTFLSNRKKPSEIVYKHPLLKDILEPTSGLIIFQEQLQVIYHVLAGVPLEDTDAIRKAFTKKDASNKEKAAQERERLRDEFIEKCYEANNIDPEVSLDIFMEMEKYVKYSFNKSHAVAYATVSYQCAHLLTYFPDEWISAYIDYCIEDKGKVAGYEDPKAVALSEAQNLGYEISKPDINHSGKGFTVKDKKLIPSFSSIKGIGATAQAEIFQNRPYEKLEDLLWNANGTWKHSKFNKRGLSALIKVGGLESMGIVGPGKQFENYAQLHHVIVDNGDLLKKSVTSKSKDQQDVLTELIEQSKSIKDWTLSEKVKFTKDLSGSVDISMIVTPAVRSFFKENKIVCIDDWKKEKEMCWAVVEHCTLATTKTGRKYCRLKLVGDAGQSMMCFLWNFNPFKDKEIAENSLIIGSFKKSNFGLSTSFGKFDILSDQSEEEEEKEEGEQDK